MNKQSSGRVSANSAFRIPNSELAPRRAFTLIELMVTCAIIGIMAITVLFALFGAQESAREAKTKSLITKLNNVVMPKYEAFRTRRVPLVLTPPSTSDSNYASLIKTYTYEASRARLDILRELMRLELPDHWSDVTDDPQPHTYNPAFSSSLSTVQIARPAVSLAYLAAYNSAGTPPTPTYQGAECLYLIATMGATDNLGGKDLFNANNIDDVDKDGFNEFIDGWGNPISFVRWAAGFPSDLGKQVSGTVASGSATSMTSTNVPPTPPIGTYVGCSILFTSGALSGQAATITQFNGGTFQFLQTMNTTSTMGDTFMVMDPDPFDPMHIYPTQAMPNGSSPTSPAPQRNATFAVYPLIYSYGADKIPDITTLPQGTYDAANVNNDPFASLTTAGGSPILMGAPQDLPNFADSANGADNSKDNIHNHLMGTR